MEFESQLNSSIDLIDPKGRVQSSLRMKYAAEVQLIIGKWGSLEAMRNTLGLSQRKVCQLLLVDPSAWTRWTRSDSEAPPHIYRSLSWFLSLQEKHPELSPFHYLQTVARPQVPTSEIKKISEQMHLDMNHHFSRQIQELLQKNQQMKKWILVQSTLIALLFALSLFFLLKR